MTHGYVTCTECDKPRNIYSLKKPSEEQMELLCGYLESVDYSCGDDLFGNLSGQFQPLAPQFAVKRKMACRLNVDKAYYNHGDLPSCCDICGDEDNLMSRAETWSRLKGKKCLPICEHR